MKKKEWNEGLNHLDPDLVEKYVAQKDRLRQKKRQRNMWLRFGAVAACFALIVGAIIVVPTLRRNDPNSVTPSKVPVWNNAQFSAEDIAELFGATNKDSVSTNAYTKIYVPDARYLYIDKIPDEEYLDLYQYNSKENKLNRKEFEEFIDSFLPKLATAINADIPQYEINEKNSYANGKILEVRGDIGTYDMSIRQDEARSYFNLYNHSEKDARRIILEGEPIQIDQRLSDEEIIHSIQSIKNKLYDIFGVSFSDTKITRTFGSYSEYGAEFVYIYFYNKSSHGLNLKQSGLESDYIVIYFDNFSNYSGDIVSDSILTVASVSYVKSRNNILNQFLPIAKAKKISLEDAEALLYNGYVFGGHSCPLCMAAQDKVSFEGYDFVDIEYVLGYDGKTYRPTIGFPFYAFYKKIGTSRNGNAIYAKTYVSAIEVSGYDDYFQNQKSNHRDNSYSID